MAKKVNVSGLEQMMVWIMLLGVVLGVAGVGCSCTRTIYVPQIQNQEVMVRDTIERYRHRVDTVMIRDSVIDIRRGDTVRKEIWHYRERVKVRVDTVNRVHCDTLIVYQQQVVPERALEMSARVRWKRGWVMVVILVLLIVAMCIYRKFSGIK